MRNDRSAPSAFHAEVRNKFTNNFFISDYYPINFIASDNYVFFNTLYSKGLGSTGSNLASKAATWLYGPMRNPTRNFRNNPNAKYMQALSFLETAADVEYTREVEFLEKYAAKNPELRSIIEDCYDAGPDKYFNLINALNLALKGRKQYEIELNKEIERIQARQEIMRRDEAAKKEGRYVAVKKGSNKKKLTSEEYAIRHELNGDPTIGDTVLNPYYNFDGKKIFESMFKKNSDFSVIVEHVMVQYGSRILDTRNGILKLNKQQAVAMIKVLVDAAYKILATEFYGVLKKVKGETRSARRERIQAQLDEMTAEGGRLNEIFNEITNAPDPATSLTSIAKQNNIPINADDMKELGHSTKTFNARIKKMWEIEKAQGKTDKSYRAWREEKDLTEQDVREFIYMMANVSVQTYYTNEGMAVSDAIRSGMTAALGGSVNAPTDVNAGFLVCDFSYEEYPASVQRKAQELITGAQKKISKAQAEMLDRQQKVTDRESYEANITELKAMNEKQLEILKELKGGLEELGIEAEDMITHINIHETIKGYASIDATTEKFTGASFGTKLTDQMEILDSMLLDGQITPLDTKWLTFALINCGEGMIGSDNKHALEDYLSGYVGLLMFSDASFIAQDISDYLGGMMSGDISNIHLYILNDKYVPSSYILHETYIAMEKFLDKIDVETHGTTLTLSTYTSPNAYKVYPEASWSLEDLAGPAWVAESQAALEDTHLQMHFLRGFLSLLQQLQSQLQSL